MKLELGHQTTYSETFQIILQEQKLEITDTHHSDSLAYKLTII
jgi:hypothetical protein